MTQPTLGFMKAAIAAVLLATSWAWASEKAPENLTEEQVDPNAITGAGAHFSWVLFDAIKPGVEEKLGRPLKIYGKNSMMGVGCNAGIKNATKNIPGHETFGMVCCTLKKEEIEKNGLTVHNLALEPIRILVNKSNPINDLPVEKIRAIFRGDIKNWAEVGGQDKPIVVVTRLHCKGRPGHWKTILPSEDDFRKERLDVKSASEMAERINDFPGSIGHIGATWEYKDDDMVKYIKVSGYEPNAKNLANKKYPFYRQLSAVTAGTVTDDLKMLLNEVQNGAGFKKASKRYGLLPN